MINFTMIVGFCGSTFEGFITNWFIDRWNTESVQLCVLFGSVLGFRQTTVLRKSASLLVRNKKFRKLTNLLRVGGVIRPLRRNELQVTEITIKVGFNGSIFVLQPGL